MNVGDELVVRLPGSPLARVVEVVDVVGDVVSLRKVTSNDGPEVYHLHDIELLHDPYPTEKSPHARRISPRDRAKRLTDALSR